MLLVRRALSAPETDSVLVKSVALAHGFWHLGHFAAGCRALFGEMPSQTLQAAKAAGARPVAA